MTKSGQAPVSWREKSATIMCVSLPDLLVALAWIGGGLAVWGRRRMRGSAGLMVWVGVAWLLGDAFQPLVLLHWGALAHLLIAYPSGRLGSRLRRVRRSLAYAASLLAAVLPGSGWAFCFAIALPVATLVRFVTANGAVRRSRAAPLAVSRWRRGGAQRRRGHERRSALGRTSSRLASRRWHSRPTCASPTGRARLSLASWWTSVAALPTAWSMSARASGR